MLFELQDAEVDSGDTKNDIHNGYEINKNNLSMEDNINYNITNLSNNSINSKLNTLTPIIPLKSRWYRLSTKVLSSKSLLEHILSYIPIDSLSKCARVSSNWYLIMKYVVPIPLVNLRYSSNIYNNTTIQKYNDKIYNKYILECYRLENWCIGYQERIHFLKQYY